MPLADFPVVGVVGRGYFYGARPEVLIDVIVCNNRDTAAGQRKHEFLPYQMSIAGIIGVYGNRGIAQKRFGTGCRYFDIFRRGRHAVFIGEGV